MERRIKRPVEAGGTKRLAESERKGVTHEYGHDCQKCRSVIKKPCFIFNGQPDSDL